MDQAIHKLNVGHYTLDVKVSQLMDRVIRVDGETSTTHPQFTFHQLIFLYSKKKIAPYERRNMKKKQ